MGLDLVELILEVEESFEIKLPDDRASEIQTVGDLYQLILELHGTSVAARETRKVCLSAATFREIRRGLHKELPIATGRLRPSDRLESILPRSFRGDLWITLDKSLDLRLPKLVRSRRVTLLLLVLTVIFAAAGGAAAWEVVGFGWVAVASSACGLVAAAGVFWLTKPLAIHPRASFSSFRGLTEDVLARNFGELSRRFQASSPADVWNALKTIFVAQLGVTAERVKPEARLIADLGLD